MRIVGKSLLFSQYLLACVLSASLFIFTNASFASTLVYCAEANPENLVPSMGTNGATFNALRPVYDQLVEFERGTTTLVPGLAERWEFSADGREVTFFLRKGVQFHSTASWQPTRAFNADDVLFSFNRQRDPNHPYNKVSGGNYAYFSDLGWSKLILAIEKLDAYTVKFTLSEPSALFLINIALDFGSIQSAEFAGEMARLGTPERFDLTPVGTGPFRFIAYQKDNNLRYEANESYWAGRPGVDTLIITIATSASVRLSKLKAGECQLMTAPSPNDLAEIAADPTLKLVVRPGMNIGYLAMNTQKKPFDDVRVRRAMAYAIDKKNIIKVVFGGTGEMAKNFVPPNIWAFNDEIEDYPYDPEKAKELLASAGITEPLQLDLWFMSSQRAYNPNGRLMGEMMQADLARVGIQAKLVTYEAGEYRKRLYNGEHSLAQLGWTGDNGDPDNFFFLMGCDAARVGGQNIAKWCNEAFENRLQKAKVSLNSEERKGLYQEMQVIMHDEVPVLNIGHSFVYEAARKEVENYIVSPLGRRDFTHVKLN